MALSAGMNESDGSNPETKDVPAGARTADSLTIVSAETVAVKVGPRVWPLIEA